MIIALVAVGVLGTGIALAESEGDDDGFNGRAGECVQLGVSGHEGGLLSSGGTCGGEEDDDGGPAANIAPVGTVAPPNNGFFTSGSTPAVSVR
jgi:hypothetical protein